MIATDDLERIREEIAHLSDDKETLESGLERLARRITRRIRGTGEMGRAEHVARELWAGGRPVERRLAVRLLRRYGSRLPDTLWELFRAWILDADDPELEEEIAVGLVGALVSGDRSRLRVLRDWTESSDMKLRRAGLLAAKIRVGRLADVEAAFFLCEPLMRSPEKEIQSAAERLLQEAQDIDGVAVQDFLTRWCNRTSSWARPAVKPDPGN